MKKILLLFPLLLLLSVYFNSGCSCESHQMENSVPLFTGFTNPEDLARFYLKTVSEKDMEALSSLFLNESDFKLLNLKKVNKQHIMSAFTHNKRLFLNKNKELLGSKLDFLSFRVGTEIKINPDASIFRGARILAEKSDGQRVSLEINFLIKVKGYWKVLLLRYLRPGANAGQGPSVTTKPGNKSPSMKVPGELPKMEIKVTKIEGDKETKEGKGEESKDDDQGETITDLEKLFTQ